MQATTRTTTEHKPATPTEEHRNEARVRIKAGETASILGGGSLQLIRLVLTDEGPLAQEDGAPSSSPRSSAPCALKRHAGARSNCSKPPSAPSSKRKGG